jgi:hypothetical protein
MFARNPALSASQADKWPESDAPEIQPPAGARSYWGLLHRTQFLGIARLHRFPTFHERFSNYSAVIAYAGTTG